MVSFSNPNELGRFVRKIGVENFKDGGTAHVVPASRIRFETPYVDLSSYSPMADAFAFVAKDGMLFTQFLDVQGWSNDLVFYSGGSIFFDPGTGISSSTKHLELYSKGSIAGVGVDIANDNGSVFIYGKEGVLLTDGEIRSGSGGYDYYDGYGTISNSIIGSIDGGIDGGERGGVDDLRYGEGG